ncbi:hypothetical protein C8J56DRAFT_891508 [Mycena floridula]|nr:hypothetical protein C8J56DRAFT_891508 [Mycena floridula]
MFLVIQRNRSLERDGSGLVLVSLLREDLAVSFPPRTHSLALDSSMELDLRGIRRTKENSKKSMLQFLLWAHVIMGCVRVVKAGAGDGLICKSAMQFRESDDGLCESLQEVESVEALISVKGSLIWDVIIMRDTVSPRYYAQDSLSALGYNKLFTIWDVHSPTPALKTALAYTIFVASMPPTSPYACHLHARERLPILNESMKPRQDFHRWTPMGSDKQQGQLDSNTYYPLKEELQILERRESVSVNITAHSRSRRKNFHWRDQFGSFVASLLHFEPTFMISTCLEATTSGITESGLK